MTIETDLARLTAGLDRDEALARAASPGPWHANAEHDEVWAVDDIEVCTGFALSNNQLRNTVDYIVEFDPKRSLRQAEAIRRAIEESQRYVGRESSETGDVGYEEYVSGHTHACERILSMLAGIYTPEEQS